MCGGPPRASCRRHAGEGGCGPGPVTPAGNPDGSCSRGGCGAERRGAGRGTCLLPGVRPHGTGSPRWHRHGPAGLETGEQPSSARARLGAGGVSRSMWSGRWLDVSRCRRGVPGSRPAGVCLRGGLRTWPGSFQLRLQLMHSGRPPRPSLLSCKWGGGKWEKWHRRGDRQVSRQDTPLALCGAFLRCHISRRPAGLKAGYPSPEGDRPGTGMRGCLGGRPAGFFYTAAVRLPGRGRHTPVGPAGTMSRRGRCAASGSGRLRTAGILPAGGRVVIVVGREWKIGGGGLAYWHRRRQLVSRRRARILSGRGIMNPARLGRSDVAPVRGTYPAIPDGPSTLPGCRPGAGSVSVDGRIPAGDLCLEVYFPYGRPGARQARATEPGAVVGPEEGRRVAGSRPAPRLGGGDGGHGVIAWVIMARSCGGGTSRRN